MGGRGAHVGRRPCSTTRPRAGFKWSKPQKLWYARQSPRTIEAANRIAGKGAESSPKGSETAPKDAVQQRAEFHGALAQNGRAAFGGVDYQVTPVGRGEGFFLYRTEGHETKTSGPWTTRRHALDHAVDDAFPPAAEAAPVDNAPKQTVDRLKPGEKPDWTEIGKNNKGYTLYQDQRGVRSYVVNGTRHTEPVGMNPTRGGVEFSVDRGLHPDWAVVESPPTAWRDVLAALPKVNGQPDLDMAARLMYEISGKKQPSFNDLTAEQKQEMLDRLKAPSTPTGRVEQQAQAQGARAEMDHAEGQTAAMPVTAAATADPGIPEAERFKPGDTVYIRSPWGAPGGREHRVVVNVSDDGRQVTLAGGLQIMHEGLERQPEGSLQGEAGAPTSNVETGHELQGSVPPGNAPAGAGHVQRAGEERPAGQIRPGEERGGARPAGGTAGAGAEGRGRPAAGSAGAAPGRGAGDGRDAGLSGAGEPAASGAAPGSAAAKIQGRNLALAPGEVDEGRGPVQKAKDNLAAIALAKKILKEDRPATREEQVQLAKYVGWGGLSGAFKDSNGNFSRGLEETGRQLQQILTPEEYRTAQRSTQYAHYTAENVIRAMWDAVRQMGFRGGSVFEPGMGVGHFAGMMPADIAAKTRYEGIELDHLTAKIAKLIYPESGVRRGDFTATPMPENSFDLVIGNPPFSDAVIHADPKYSARNFMLHDYFFAKSLDSVRPGGLLGFVTSAGTMNKIDPAARRYLAERAEFVGGVRLPSTAFKRNAGTEVTTDVLFFKKRPEAIEFTNAEPPPPWTETVPRQLPGPDGTPIAGNVNRYFSEHPEQVLGREGFFDKLYRGRYGVHADEGEGAPELTAKIYAALDRLPKAVMEQPLSSEQRAIRDLEAPERKDGSFYIKDGELYQYRQGAGPPVSKRGAGQAGMTVADYDRVRRLIPIRDALRDVFRADLTDDAGLSTSARAALNQHYDAFVRVASEIRTSAIPPSSDVPAPKVMLNPTTPQVMDQGVAAGKPYTVATLGVYISRTNITPSRTVTRSRSRRLNSISACVMLAKRPSSACIAARFSSVRFF
jgi:hypothetical protein